MTDQEIAKGGHQMDKDGVTDATARHMQANIATYTVTPKVAQLASRAG